MAGAQAFACQGQDLFRAGWSKIKAPHEITDDDEEEDDGDDEKTRGKTSSKKHKKESEEEEEEEVEKTKVDKAGKKRKSETDEDDEAARKKKGKKSGKKQKVPSDSDSSAASSSAASSSSSSSNKKKAKRSKKKEGNKKGSKKGGKQGKEKDRRAPKGKTALQLAKQVLTNCKKSVSEVDTLISKFDDPDKCTASPQVRSAVKGDLQTHKETFTKTRDALEAAIKTGSNDETMCPEPLLPVQFVVCHGCCRVLDVPLGCKNSAPCLWQVLGNQGGVREGHCQLPQGHEKRPHVPEALSAPRHAFAQALARPRQTWPARSHTQAEASVPGLSGRTLVARQQKH